MPFSHTNEHGNPCSAISAVTGWAFDSDEGLRVRLRAINIMRAYNIESGIGGNLDRPSIRYSSVPKDGSAQGKDIRPHLERMLQIYYNMMGWN